MELIEKMYIIEFALFDSREVIKVAEHPSLEEAQKMVENMNSPTRGYQLGVFRIAT